MPPITFIDGYLIKGRKIKLIKNFSQHLKKDFVDFEGNTTEQVE
jgi:hypothetical protein